MNNEEKTGTINELYGSVQGIHNYVEIYYYQQAREIAAVTAIAMLRDNVPPADVRICIDNWYGVEIPEHAMKILEAEAKSDEEEEQLTGKRRTCLLYTSCSRPPVQSPAAKSPGIFVSISGLTLIFPLSVSSAPI